MTTPSRDGRDKPFCDWLRKHPDLDSYTISLYSGDVDQTFLKYKTWVDAIGTRDVKLMLDLEVKCWGAYPSEQQVETLYFRHQLLKKKKKLYSSLLRDAISLWHFGQYILRFINGERPDECETIEWGRFLGQGKVDYRTINERHLVQILGFIRRPDNFDILDLRRHHKTQLITTLVTKDRLFPMEETIIRRS